jgi:hypothetical protein
LNSPLILARATWLETSSKILWRSVGSSRTGSRSSHLHFRKLLLQFLHFFIGAVLQVNQPVSGILAAADQLIELRVSGASIAVLAVLDEENGQEG